MGDEGMNKMINGKVIPMTAEEIAEFERKAAKFDAEIAKMPHAPLSEFDFGKTYVKGDLVSAEGNFFRLKTERARGINPTDKTYWENISLTDLIKEISKENEQ